MSWLKLAASNGMDDVFEENADERDISAKEWALNMKRRTRDGYVDGADAGEDAALEVGFQEGFREGAAKTLAVGRLRGIRSRQLVPGGAPRPALPRLRHKSSPARFAARGFHRDGNHEGHGGAPSHRRRPGGEPGGSRGGAPCGLPRERLLHGHGFSSTLSDVAFGVRRQRGRLVLVLRPRSNLQPAAAELQGHRGGARAASRAVGAHQ
ncbi:OTU deubiquitinase with linear linkage specificity a isoform X2 [Vanacampus margaritifer]